MVVRMEKPGFSPESSPAALPPARRLSWLASEGHVCASRLPTQSRLVRRPLHVGMQASTQLAGVTFHENLPFFGLREVVLGLVRSTSRVRTFAARKRRFFGMIPSQRLKRRFRGVCSLSFRTDKVQLAYSSPMGGVVR